MIKVYAKGHDLTIAPFLTVKEFQCRCTRKTCQTVPVDARLADAWTEFRMEVNAALIVLSGHRCEAHNAEVGGVKESYHTRGEAIDVAAHALLELKKLSVDQVKTIARKSGFTFVKYYPEKGFFHLDVGMRS